MFFTAGKYAIMGIFPSRFLDRHAPKFLPTLLTLFALTEACLFSFLVSVLPLSLDRVQES